MARDVGVWIGATLGFAGLFLWILAAGCGDREETPAATSSGDAAGDAAEQVPVASGPTPAVLRRGEELFARHCSSCHGEKGFGDGDAAWLLYPRARDFSRTTFRLVSTDNGFPSDEDLLHTITNGMPGSAMPPWAHFPESDREALVQWVKVLTFEGKARRLIDEDIEEGIAREIAGELCAPGSAVTFAAEIPASAALLERGRETYESLCQSCHDPDGRGRLKRDLVDSDGVPVFARDITKGIFKGGADPVQLATRLAAGMPGSPMPTFLDQLEKPEDLWAVVHHVRSLVPSGAQERVEQKRTDLVARRASSALTTDPDASAWSNTESAWLATMPLWWRDDRIEGVTVQALHDGQRLALRLEWEDSSRDDHQIRQAAFTDGVAVQLSPAEEPPFFAMGQKGEAVAIWHWKASREADLHGYRDVQHSFPDAVWDVYPALKKPPFGRHSPIGEFATVEHDPLYLSGWGAGNLVSRPDSGNSVEDLTAEGFGTLTARSAQEVRGCAIRGSGVWKVVFLRDLQGEGSVRLAAGATVSLAFAVWDGSSLDRNGQKSVTIWHRLSLER